jgi:hypothetical protein
MLKKIVIFFGGLMLAVGLLGFFIPNVLFLVQFDLWQSLIYAVLGATGLQIGLGQTKDLAQLGYLKALAIVNLVMLLMGLTWPNWGDIFHLEVPEHFFHGIVGISSALAADFFRKQQITQ